MEITRRHDQVRKEVAAFCKICVGNQGQVEEEVVYERRGELSACRIDIFVTTALAEICYVDTTVVNPGAKAYVYGSDLGLVNRQAGSSYVQGYAAEIKSESKRRDHLQRLSPAQMTGFVPFAVETSGRLGQAAVAFLQKMELCHNARLGDEAAGAIRKRRAWFQLALGMALVRGTAKVLEAARAKIRMRRDPAQVEVGAVMFDAEEGAADDYQPAYAAGGVGEEGNGLYEDFSLDDEEGPPYDYRLAGAMADGLSQNGNAQEYVGGMVYDSNEEVKDCDYQQLEPDLAAGGAIFGDGESRLRGELPHRGLGYGGVDDYQQLEQDPAAGGGFTEGEFGYELFMFFKEGVAVEDETGGPEV